MLLVAQDSIRETLRTTGWVMLGASAAFLGTGIGTHIGSSVREDALEDAERQGAVTASSRRAVQDEISSLATTAYVMYALAGAGAIATTLLLVYSQPADTAATPSVAPTVGWTQGGGLLGVSGRF